MAKKYIIFAWVLMCTLWPAINGAEDKTVTLWMCPGGQAPQPVTINTTIVESTQHLTPHSTEHVPATPPELEHQVPTKPAEPPPTPGPGTIIASSLHPSTSMPETVSMTQEAVAPVPMSQAVAVEPFTAQPRTTINPGVGLGTGNTGLVGPVATRDNVGWSAESIITGASQVTPTSTGSGGGGV